jgi:hemolysin type calcium-binding protein
MLALIARRGSVVGLVALLASVLAPATASHAAVPTCFGQPATWVGTPGDDTVGVHQLGDQAVVVTLGGADTVRLGPGDNLVCTGSGNDSVFARSGNDEIATGSGNDEVAGQRGNDTILGGPGADALYGRYGANTINGGGGNADRLVGHLGIRPLSPAKSRAARERESHARFRTGLDRSAKLFGGVHHRLGRAGQTLVVFCVELLVNFLSILLVRVDLLGRREGGDVILAQPKFSVSQLAV